MVEETRTGGPQGAFEPTLWTMVLKARDRSTPEGQEALERLVELYWKPVYYFIRRKGHDIEEAKDLTQEFFARLLEREALRKVERPKGKFRSFLLAVLEHFLCDQYDRRRARKRRPRFDFHRADTQYEADRSFERDWAMVVLERAFVRLQEENPRGAAVARALRGERVPYADLARQFETTEANIKVIVHRARKRLRTLLLDELQATVSYPGQEEEELADLFRAFSL